MTGCSYIKAAKTLAPETFGMDKISSTVYVDEEMTEKTRTELLKSCDTALKNIELMYGTIISRPDIIACSTEVCFHKFGGKSARAKNYGGSTFLLSPRGLTSQIISHEWSHNELYVRIDSFWKMRNIPQWFDEGLAVVVSNEPTHSQKVWLEIKKKAIPVPSLNELVSLADWFTAIEKYGEHKANKLNPEKLKVVYATAGNEVRQWLDLVGQKGLLQLIKSIKSGEAFTFIYQEIKDDAKTRQASNI
jgi:hypothetical protein